jgi:hypothetical protein
MWEVFDPRNGKPIYRVPFKWLAKLLAHGNRDYARQGDGWL